jgi:hypothetical protein
MMVEVPGVVWGGDNRVQQLEAQLQETQSQHRQQIWGLQRRVEQLHSQLNSAEGDREQRQQQQQQGVGKVDQSELTSLREERSGLLQQLQLLKQQEQLLRQEHQQVADFEVCSTFA